MDYRTCPESRSLVRLSGHVVSDCVVSRCGTSRNVVSECVVSRCGTSRNVVSECVVSRCGTSRCDASGWMFPDV